MIKTIMFDFDGTLTYKTKNTWKAIWEELGYDIKDPKSGYLSQMKLFNGGLIDYQGWCDITAQSFIKKNMSKDTLSNVTKDIKLMNGFDDFVDTLSKQNIKLNIVSGNFTEVIINVLKDKRKYFESINANNLIYDNNGYLTKIIGTNYDYEGKAKFIQEYATSHNISPQEICFIGNGNNDEWAYKSGCKTICINPDDTNHNDKNKWHKSITNIDNINDLLPLIFEDETK